MCKTCRDKLGVEFDDWQDGAGRVILAKRADGTLAAMIDGVGLSLPRQVGKTYLVGALVFALCVNMPGLLVIWSAHHARTHGETFLAMQGFADRQKVQPHVFRVFVGSGDEEIRFHNGSRILFGARERGFGRGIPGVDVLVMDEAQILSDKALANMLATLNTSSFGLQLYIGTPPKPVDMSESFTRMRTEALAGTLHDGAWIEFGAERGVSVDDRAALRKANPSYPKRTPLQSILRLKRKLTPEDFLREGLGIWDEDAAVGPIGRVAWLRCRDVLSKRVGPPSFGVEVANDQVSASITVCGRSAGGLPRLAVAATGPGVDWVPGWLTDNGVKRVAMDTDGAAEPLAADLTRLGLEVVQLKTGDVIEACGSLQKLVNEGGIVQIGDKPLEDAVKDARKREIGDKGGWVFGRKASGGADITPLQAAAWALWLHLTNPDYDAMDSVF